MFIFNNHIMCFCNFQGCAFKMVLMLLSNCMASLLRCGYFAQILVHVRYSEVGGISFPRFPLEWLNVEGIAPSTGEKV